MFYIYKTKYKFTNYKLSVNSYLFKATSGNTLSKKH